MNKSFKILLGVFTMLLVSVQSAMAQCAMCRATVENNVSNGDTTVGAALNIGILYLFLAPYLLLMTLGYFWYKNAKRKKKMSL
ncbi:hypothetical protein [Cyclobacterium amurskyense]|jgi:hypothetical protein|uniref:hypothetical protein n=1 Tax=Cyclobacterium amurskyense TaxID=320787 RepID=UPI0030DD6988|tara:strand:- start:44045 stop:44293 length:249 start_codon:yes stop_codon:yes gene_type:complete